MLNAEWAAFPKDERRHIVLTSRDDPKRCVRDCQRGDIHHVAEKHAGRELPVCGRCLSRKRSVGIVTPPPPVQRSTDTSLDAYASHA